MSLATLNMYALPVLQPEFEAFWAGLATACRAEGLEAVPERLSWSGDTLAAWLDPDLFIAQTCGYPLTHALAGRVRLVATPCYRVAGAVGPTYRSVVLVREDDPARDLEGLRGRRVAYNGSDSQSGYSAPRLLFAPLARQGRFFGAALESGTHLASAAMVRAGEADCCAMDGVCYALCLKAAPKAVAALRVLAETQDAPNLPFITSLRRSDAEVAAIFYSSRGGEIGQALVGFDELRPTIGVARVIYGVDPDVDVKGAKHLRPRQCIG